MIEPKSKNLTSSSCWFWSSAAQEIEVPALCVDKHFVAERCPQNMKEVQKQREVVTVLHRTEGTHSAPAYSAGRDIGRKASSLTAESGKAGGEEQLSQGMDPGPRDRKGRVDLGREVCLALFSDRQGASER